MTKIQLISHMNIIHNVSRLQEVAMNQDQAFTNINKTLN